MTNKIGEGRMDPLEVGVVHQAMPQGIIEHGAQTSEEVQLATDRPQTNDRRKAHMRLGEVIPGTGVMRAQGGVMRAKEEPIRATRAEGNSKFIDGVKIDELRTMLATHYTPLSINASTPEELRLKSKEYLLLKPPSRSGYFKNNYGNFNNEPANQGNNWYKPRDDMDKGRSFANCSSTDHHVSACPTYKQGMKAIGFSLEDEDASEVDHEVFIKRVIAKFGPRCFFCNLEGHFKSDCPQFWDAVADIKVQM